MNTWAEALFFRAPKEPVGRNFVVPPTRACCALPASCPGVGGGSHSNWPQTLLGTLGLALSGDVISCVLTVHCLPVAQVLGGFAFLARDFVCADSAHDDEPASMCEWDRGVAKPASLRASMHAH